MLDKLKKAQTAYDNAVSAHAKLIADAADSATIEAARVNVEKKQKSLTIVLEKVEKAHNDALFTTRAGVIVKRANKLSVVARHANGNLLDSNLHVNEAFFHKLNFCIGLLDGVNFEGNFCDYVADIKSTKNAILIKNQTVECFTFLLSDSATSLIKCLDAIYKHDKLRDGKKAFSDAMAELSSLGVPDCLSCEYEPLLLAMPDSVRRGHELRYDSIGADGKPLALVVSKEAVKAACEEITARVEAFNDARIGALEHESRAGVFAGVRALNKALETLVKKSKNRDSDIVDFIVDHKSEYLQAALDMACREALEGKGKVGTGHLSRLTAIINRHRIEVNPRNAESRFQLVQGGQEIVKYVQFILPWLGFKLNDGGLYERPKADFKHTLHIGPNRPVWVNGKEGNEMPYPPITLMSYLELIKRVGIETRVTNARIKRMLEKTKA